MTMRYHGGNSIRQTICGFQCERRGKKLAKGGGKKLLDSEIFQNDWTIKYSSINFQQVNNPQNRSSMRYFQPKIVYLATA